MYTSVQIVQEDKRELTNILESCYDELNIIESIGLYNFVSEFKFYFIEFHFIIHFIEYFVLSGKLFNLGFNYLVSPPFFFH